MTYAIPVQKFYRTKNLNNCEHDNLSIGDSYMEKQEDVQIVNNLEIHPDKDWVVVSVNLKVYPLEVVYKAADTFTSKAWIIMNGDADKEVLVKLIPKQGRKENLEAIGREFDNELICSMVDMNIFIKNQSMRERFLQKVLPQPAGPQAEGHDPRPQQQGHRLPGERMEERREQFRQK